MIEVWTYRLDGDGPDGALIELLSDGEKKRYRAFHFERHRREYLYAHAVKRLALSRYRPVDPRNWEFTTGRWGKPCIAAEGAGLQFNLSHTAGLVACAVSDEGEVGLDVERVDRMVEAVAIAKRFFTDEEVQQIDLVDEDRARNAFFRIWTLKEAYVKAVGRGFDLPLKDFRFFFGEHGAVQGPAGWFFWEFAIEESYQMAVACKGGAPKHLDARELMRSL